VESFWYNEELLIKLLIGIGYGIPVTIKSQNIGCGALCQVAVIEQLD
jgi:hypothetical protein